MHDSAQYACWLLFQVVTGYVAGIRGGKYCTKVAGKVCCGREISHVSGGKRCINWRQVVHKCDGKCLLMRHNLEIDAGTHEADSCQCYAEKRDWFLLRSKGNDQ